MGLVVVFIIVVEYTASLGSIRVHVSPIADGGCKLLSVLYVVAAVGVIFGLLILVVAAAEVRRVIYRTSQSMTQLDETPRYKAAHTYNIVYWM